MPHRLQLRRGDTAEHAAFTGALAELTCNTDDFSLVVHDGVTPGGHPVGGGASLTDPFTFKGGIDCSANPNYPAADAGDVYKVTVAGKIGGASGPNVEAGDTLYCIADSTASGNHATVGSSWVILQTNIDGAVTGPASATDGHAALFDGPTGKIIKSAGAAPYVVGGTDVPITDGGTGASSASTAFDNLKQDATTSATGVVEKATTAETQARSSSSVVVTPDGLADFVRAALSAEQATTSGSTQTISGIAAGAKGVVVMGEAISSNGTSSIGIQLGHAGSGGTLITTGYTGSVGNATGTVTSITTRFNIASPIAAAGNYSFVAQLWLKDATNNTWACLMNGARNDSAQNYFTLGMVTLGSGNALDRVALITADTFDAGDFSVMTLF